jgi:hypothetical protein
LPLCPLCNDTHETIHHVLTCSKNPERIQNFIDDIVKITSKYFKTQGAILHIINNIKTNDNTDAHTHVQNQNEVGWNQLIQGKFTTTLHDYIQPTLKTSIKTQKVIAHLGIELDGGKLGSIDYSKLNYKTIGL